MGAKISDLFFLGGKVVFKFTIDSIRELIANAVSPACKIMGLSELDFASVFLRMF